MQDGFETRPEFTIRGTVFALSASVRTPAQFAQIPDTVDIRVLTSTEVVQGGSYSTNLDEYILVYAERVASSIIAQQVRESSQEQSRMVVAMAQKMALEKFEFLENALEDKVILEESDTGTLAIFESKDGVQAAAEEYASKKFTAMKLGDIHSQIDILKEGALGEHEVNLENGLLKLRAPAVSLARKYMQEEYGSTNFDAQPPPFEIDGSYATVSSIQDRVEMCIFFVIASFLGEINSDSTLFTLPYCCNAVTEMILYPAAFRKDFNAKEIQFIKRGLIPIALGAEDELARSITSNISIGELITLRSAVGIEVENLWYSPAKVELKTTVKNGVCHYVIGLNVNLMIDSVRIALAMAQMLKFNEQNGQSLQIEEQDQECVEYKKVMSTSEFRNLFLTKLKFMGYVSLTQQTLKRPIFVVAGGILRDSILQATVEYTKLTGEPVYANEIDNSTSPILHRFYYSLYEQSSAEDGEGHTQGICQPFIVVLSTGSLGESFLLPTPMQVSGMIVTTTQWKRVRAELCQFLYTVAKGVTPKRSAVGSGSKSPACEYVVRRGKSMTVDEYILAFPWSADRWLSLISAHRAYMKCVNTNAQPGTTTMHQFQGSARLTAARNVLGL